MKNIFRIELPTLFGMKTVNSYLIKGEEVVLIDCGENTDACFKTMEAGLKVHGLVFQNVDRIIITHAHVDHMGMAERLAESCDADVWVNDLVWDWACDPESMWIEREDLMIPALEAFFAPSMRPIIMKGYKEMMGSVREVWQPIQKTRLKVYAKEGQILIDNKTWKTMYMPGHSQTQSIFYHEPSSCLLSADMLLKITPTPVIEKSLTDPQKRNRGIIQMIESYDRLLNTEISTVFPGHYEPFSDAHQVIEYQVSRIYIRANEALTLIKSGKDTFFELYQTLYDGRFSMPALIMLIGYLDLLEVQGKIHLVETDGFIKMVVV